MKTKKNDHNKILPLLIPITAFILFMIKILSGYTNSEGIAYVGFSSLYPLLLFAGYLSVTLLFIPLIIKTKKEEASLYILPLMLFSALGMMRIDSSVTITSTEADYLPAIMFLIFFISILTMAFSGHTLTGAVFSLVAIPLCPSYSLAFCPFITAASLLLRDKDKKEKNISLAINTAVFIIGSIYSLVKTELLAFSFSKKYIPVLVLCAVLIVFFIIKKDYRLIPLGILPLFALAAGIFTGAFPTPLFTLSGCIAPMVILLGTAVLSGENEKIKSYGQKLTHNPVLYLIIAVFVIHTAYPIFVSPGFFRDSYI